MDVRRHYDARVHEGIEALDRELRAAETDHLLGYRALREERHSECLPLHLGRMSGWCTR